MKPVIEESVEETVLVERHVLIVEDEPLTLTAVSSRLEDEGYIVHKAKDAQEGLAFLQWYPIAVVFSDHQMPGMTGLELLDKVREQYPNIIRIITSAGRDQSDFYDALSNKLVHHFLPKTGDLDKVHIAIDSAYQLFEIEKELRATPPN